MRQAGFPEERFVPIYVRGTDNAGILKRLQDRVEAVLREKQTPAA
jgi:hypothetical protein